MWFLEIFLCSWLFSSLTIFVQEILAYPPPLLHLTIPTQRKSGWPGLISDWCANAPSPAGEHVLPILCSEPHACISSQDLVPWNSMLVRNHQLPMPPSKSALDLSFTVRSPCHHSLPSCHEIWLGIMQVAAKLNSLNIWLHQVVDLPCWFIVMLTGIWLWCVLNFKTLCGCV